MLFAVLRVSQLHPAGTPRCAVKSASRVPRGVRPALRPRLSVLRKSVRSCTGRRKLVIVPNLLKMLNGSQYKDLSKNKGTVHERRINPCMISSPLVKYFLITNQIPPSSWKSGEDYSIVSKKKPMLDFDIYISKLLGSTRRIDCTVGFAVKCLEPSCISTIANVRENKKVSDVILYRMSL